MKKLFLFLIFIPSLLWSQKTAILKGSVKDEQHIPIPGVSIAFDGIGTITDANGNYLLRIPLKKTISISFSHVSYNVLVKEMKVNRVNVFRFSPTLTLKSETSG